MDVNHHWW